MEVAGQPDYKINFNLKSFKDKLQTMDLKEWKVKVSKGIEILNEVTKVLELERKTRTYIHKLYDKVSETKQRQTMKVKNLERSSRGSNTFRVCTPSSSQEATNSIFDLTKSNFI